MDALVECRGLTFMFLALSAFCIFKTCQSEDLSKKSRGDPCRPTRDYDPGKNYTVHVMPGLDSSFKLCCLHRRCPRGTFGYICSKHNPDSTECRPCGPRHYYSQSTSSDMAYRDCVGGKIFCDEFYGEYKKLDGGATANDKCACNAKLGYYNKRDPDGLDDLECVRKRCGPGLEMNEIKNDCAPCQHGYLKIGTNHRPCQQWHNPMCKTGEFSVGGSATSEPRCEKVRVRTTKVDQYNMTTLPSRKIPDKVDVYINKKSEAEPEGDRMPVTMVVIVLVCVVVVFLIIVIAAVIFGVVLRTTKKKKVPTATLR